ncbi:HK97-gp10 family putative phage morphogenesis protein [Listeria fleischmannii]|uniref:HK97-gp10 family putative phage morphogenesis protein n=1 Tax=Listeria fleischmannii TaxID=1069827 RepID=UPI003B980AA5
MVQTGLKKDKDSNSMVDVGFNKSQGWRAHFPNSGTSQQAPQKFIEKSRDRAKPVVLEVMKSYMRKGLNL